MTRRCVVALLAAAATALSISSIAHAETTPATPVPPSLQQFQPSLILSPSSGPGDASYAAIYSAGGGNCSTGQFQVALAWDGGSFASPKKATSRCIAGWRSLLPPDGARPGAHDVQAVLLNCSSPNCPPVDGTQADAQYTITGDAAPPPPPPVATSTPQPTPTPTPLGLAPAGTFPAYGCRNGIPDATPCPSQAGAVGALATGPGTEPAAPASSSTSSTSVNVPRRTVAFAAAIVGAVILVALALGWRQGAARRRKVLAAAPAPGADVTKPGAGGLGLALASLVRRRKARPTAARRVPPAEPRPGGHHAPPPPSVPPPPEAST